MGVGKEGRECGRERASQRDPAELVVQGEANRGQLIADERIERGVALFGDAGDDKENGSADPKAEQQSGDCAQEIAEKLGRVCFHQWGSEMFFGEVGNALFAGSRECVRIGGVVICWQAHLVPEYVICHE